MDVRSLRGANIDSDHCLVLSELQKGGGIKIKKCNIEKLKDGDIPLQCKQKMDNELSKSVDNTDKQYSITKKAIITTAEEILGVIGEVKTKDWFDDECEAITEKKSKAYLQMLQREHTRQYTEECKKKRREEKKFHRKKKGT
jgi:hypothetical protein